MPQHLDKEEKWFCRSELKTPVRSSLHLGAQRSCHKNKCTDFQPRRWTCCHSLRLPGQWTLRGVIQKPGPWRPRTSRAPAPSPLCEARDGIVVLSQNQRPRQGVRGECPKRYSSAAVIIAVVAVPTQNVQLQATNTHEPHRRSRKRTRRTSKQGQASLLTPCLQT